MPASVTDPTEVATIAQLAGLVKSVEAKIEGRDELLSVSIADLKDQSKKLEGWIKEVETAVGKNRGTSSTAADIRSAIPERHRRALDLNARFAPQLGLRNLTSGTEEERVVKVTAMESWLKNFIMAQNPNVAGRIGSKLYDEMDKLERAFGFDPVNKALQEDAATEGGNLVPVPLEAEVLRIEQDAATVLNLCRQVPMVAKTHNFPDLTTNLSVAIIAEEGTITPSDPAFGQKALTAKKIAVRTIASMELVQDSAVGLLSFLTTLMTEARALFLDKQILEGDGTGVNFTGLVAAAGVNAVTNGANGAVPSFAKLIEQKWKAAKRSTRRGAAFIGAPAIAQKWEGLVDSQGRPLFVAPIAGAFTSMNGNGNTPDGMLQGYPFFAHDQILINRTVGTSSDCSNQYFGPFGSAVIVGRLLGLQFGVSEHTQWATGQLDLRMISRDAVLIGIPAAMTVQTGLKTT